MKKLQYTDTDEYTDTCLTFLISNLSYIISILFIEINERDTNERLEKRKGSLRDWMIGSIETEKRHVAYICVTETLDYER